MTATIIYVWNDMILTRCIGTTARNSPTIASDTALRGSAARPAALALTLSLNECGESEIHNNCPSTKINDCALGIGDPRECAYRMPADLTAISACFPCSGVVDVGSTGWICQSCGRREMRQIWPVE